ncbi:MAG: DUF362 domain-containing protein [Clostridia bacterium]|nr:DUF362 domain-containing protein [Clostridia bacterium]
MADLLFAPCKEYNKEDVKEALRGICDLSWVREGMKVAIKVNLITALSPDRAGTTHPVVIDAMCDLLLEQGASVVIGDSPGGVWTAAYLDYVYRATGLSALEREGVTLNRDFSVKTASHPDAKIAKSFEYTGYLDACDAIINICKLKSHGMMGMSAAVKNMFGAIPGITKPQYHYRFPDPRDFSDMILDIQSYFKPRLNVVDAIVGMEGNGPTQGTPKPLGLLLAGENPYQLDLACCMLMSIDPEKVPTVEAAIRRGLSEKDPHSLSCYQDLLPFSCKDFKIPPTTKPLTFLSEKGVFSKLAGPLLRWLLLSRPVVRKKSCVGCKKCAEVCPAKAIEMKDHLPKIDRAACIRCFCCQELCPKGAMKVRKTLPFLK